MPAITTYSKQQRPPIDSNNEQPANNKTNWISNQNKRPP
jgi:hypothetical protein